MGDHHGGKELSASELSTSIIQGIHNTDVTSTSLNEIRPALLTLHLLFPHCLLDALDILDRGLITRIQVKDSNQDSAPDTATGLTKDCHAIFYAARSTQTAPYEINPQRRRFPASSQAVQQEGYHVHLTAWNCSCPAFAFSAYSRNSVTASTPPTRHVAKRISQQRVENGSYLIALGGLTLPKYLADGTEVLPPICKHLLACTLAECSAGLFNPVAVRKGCDASDNAEAPNVHELVMTIQGAAGWAAGYDMVL